MPDHLRRLEALADDTREFVILTTQDREAITAIVTAVDEAVALCRRYNSPAVNTGAHALAAKVLKILEAGANDVK